VAQRWHTLAIALGDEIPREVRLFTRGVNTSTKGAVVFDDAAAAAVLKRAEGHGVDCMIDLEHLSLDTESRAFDPDARGWGKLAVRNGELWLVDIKWTPDGEARLREKRQRYVSPAFSIDEKTQRVTRILNVAITALPATDNAMPLIAANGRSNMDPKLIKEALDALEAGDSAKALEILKALIASAAGAAEEAPPAEMAEGEPATEEEMMAEGDPEDEMIAATARAVTGKRACGEVRAALLGLREAKGSAGTLASEVATLRATVLRGELREIVRANPRKIASPKLEALVMASESTTAATALLDALPELVAAPVEQNPKPAKTEEIRLTDEDREVAKLTGTDPAKVLEFKRKAARR